MVYSLNECKVQTGNSYTTSCQYFLGLPNPQSLSVCHGHCPFFFLSIAFGELYVNFEVTTSLQKSSKWKRSKHCKLSQVHWISSGSRLWAENFGQQLSWDVCHKIELPITWFLLCRHSTTLKHHAWLWMLCAISMVTGYFSCGFTAMCNSVSRGITVQYTQNLKKLHFWRDSFLNLNLKYWKSRRSTHYSKYNSVI